MNTTPPPVKKLASMIMDHRAKELSAMIMESDLPERLQAENIRLRALTAELVAALEYFCEATQVSQERYPGLIDQRSRIARARAAIEKAKEQT